ncbi:MAG: YqhA family protein [Gemmatimonadetes bacterium]|nr:YqhA family protein [Gemmatimonadota bacterium]MBP6668913.1 YqhA family protein [Gemmatimonadales bacterium]MBK6778628.1 YqhA family protein [Gemmatimonadota bacterium]MBK7349063.1 YqhA family protein [Gemmatimonadota bacterium]MBK7714625.1 YqhA family protein [Gemmatimonadota bacterium]
MSTSPPDHPSPRLLRALSGSRYLIIIAVLSTLVAATALLAYGAYETFAVLRGVWLADGSGPKGAKGLILAFIELTDLFLLATVLYVIAIGLFELFVDDRLDLPNWLEIHDLNDLKDKLIGVVVVVMGVLFLGQVVTWDGQRDLLGYGVGIAAVIAALTWFSSQKPKKSGTST